MTFIQAVILGVVQGVAEFLPISSSGHLVIIQRLLGLTEPNLLFDIFLHLGTLVAIFVVFGNDIIDIITTKRKLGFLILLGSFVTFIIVILFVKNIEAAFSSVKVVGFMLILSGIWLIFGNLVRFGTEGLTWFKAAMIGLAQGIAALPGMSRSGATISTGIFLGLDSEAAAKFSFLLSIPAIIGAFVFKVKENGLGFPELLPNYFIGFIISCLVGVLSLKILLRILYRNRFHWFGAYCILAGIAVLLFIK